MILKNKDMVLYESAENYLEMMLVLREEKGHIRSIDIANGLGVTKPSVSVAVKRLKENGFLTMEDGGEIHLTDKGEESAKRILERHKTIAAVLMELGVDEKTACEDACKIEHDISDTSFEAIAHHLQANKEQDNK